MLSDTYDLHDLNYLEFAYDWRRDVRITARELGSAIADRLNALDAYVGRAEVIIVAHSMGGLVARWWLDHESGADRCRGLITLGTPFRGSPKAIRMLSGGYIWRSIGSRRLAETLRAFPSVHQLLPLYGCVYDKRTATTAGPDATIHPAHVHEVDIRGIDRTRAEAARSLLEALNSSPHPAMTSVVGGTGQPTLQSVTLTDTCLSFDHRPLPDDHGRSSDVDGDGTVPWVSARPLDYNDVKGLTPTFTNQSHGGLSRERGRLTELMSRIDHLLIDVDHARGPFIAPSGPPTDIRARLGLGVEEEYLTTEPIVITVRVEGMQTGTKLRVAVDDRQPREIVTGDTERPVVDLGLLGAGTHTVHAWRSDPSTDATDLDVIETIDVWPEASGA